MKIINYLFCNFDRFHAYSYNYAALKKMVRKRLGKTPRKDDNAFLEAEHRIMIQYALNLFTLRNLH